MPAPGDDVLGEIEHHALQRPYPFRPDCLHNPVVARTRPTRPETWSAPMSFRTTWRRGSRISWFPTFNSSSLPTPRATGHRQLRYREVASHGGPPRSLSGASCWMSSAARRSLTPCVPSPEDSRFSAVSWVPPPWTSASSSARSSSGASPQSAFNTPFIPPHHPQPQGRLRGHDGGLCRQVP